MRVEIEQNLLADIDTVFRDIESLSFAAYCGIASTWSVFEAAMKSQPAYERLEFYFMADRENCGRRVSERLRVLTEMTYDTKYEHPYDTAIAVYVGLLSRFYSYELPEILKPFLDRPHGWWSRRAGHEAIIGQKVNVPVDIRV